MGHLVIRRPPVLLTFFFLITLPVLYCSVVTLLSRALRDASAFAFSLPTLSFRVLQAFLG